MIFTEFAFVDQGSGETAQYIKNTAEACSLQLALHASQEYGKNAVSVNYYDDPSKVPATAVVIPWMSAIDVDGAIAYHTERGGVVSGVVDAPLARQNGEEPSVAASHEVLEAWRNPFCNTSTQAANGFIIDDEIGDPVQDKSYSITVSDGTQVQVSDFVTAAWHDPQSAGEKYSMTGALSAPHTKTDGGYYQYIDANGQRQQLGMRAMWRRPSLRSERRNKR